MPYRLGLILAAALSCAAAGRFLRPTDGSSVPVGALSIIAAGTGELKLDGKPVPAAQSVPGGVHAQVKVAAGEHELSLGEAKIRFSAGPSPNFREHPPGGSGCAPCHKAEGGEWTVIMACFGCHDQKTFPKPHQHNAEVLAECQMCHLPHGSSEKAHMKMKKDIACKQCHG